MEKLEQLKDIYLYLEENIDSLEHSTIDIHRAFVAARDLSNKEENEHDANKAQWEIEFFGLTIRENKLTGIMSGTDKDGNFFELPSVNNFTEDQYLYLLQRQRESKNPILKARYSHILWLSPRKTYEIAKDAIGAYLELIKLYEKKSKEERTLINLIDTIRNVNAIASPIKYRLDEVKAEILRLVKSYSSDLISTYVLKDRLINVMLESKKLFKKEDFIGFDIICEELANQLENNNRIEMLTTGEKVDVKLENKNNKWQKGIAETCEAISAIREDGTNIIAIEYCQRAIVIYKKLKMTDKVGSLTKKLNHLKTTMKLSSVKIDFDLTDLLKEARKIADTISEQSSDNIIHYLMNEKRLIPQEEKLSQQKNNGNAFMSIGSTTVYDNKINTSEHVDSEEEHKYHSLLFNYKQSIQLNQNHLIKELIFAAIRKEKLTSSIIIEYFKKYSWFGKNIKKGDNKPYNWLALVAPSLIEYFRQMELAFAIPKYYPNFILTIDSLVVKIEGLIRDLCEFNEGDTFYTTTDDKKRPISREKDITNLLHDDTVVNLLDKDDLLFLKFVLIEKSGLNLRHKVSHCLMTRNDYSLENMNLLIMAILRLGKYEFNSELLKIDVE